MYKRQALIIGFGKGGKTLAGALGAAGRKVAVVERSEKMYGGTCINVGCIPSKSLVHSASLSAATGGSFAEKAARYRAAIEEKDRLTGMLRQKNYDKLNSHPNIDVIHGTASFLDGSAVAVETQGETREFRAEQIFINNGARPFIPPIDGIRESAHVYLSETMPVSYTHLYSAKQTAARSIPSASYPGLPEDSVSVQAW